MKNKLTIIKPDPLGILKSTKKILDGASFVFLKTDEIPKISGKIKKLMTRKFDKTEQFHLTGNYKNDVQLIFLEDVVNFCYWPDPGNPKWGVEWPKGKIVKGGWFSLTACLARALKENPDILDAVYLKNLSLNDARKIFGNRNRRSIMGFKPKLPR
ncbi:MAG: queuosine salvage family protein [Patescibacteria group bacterium]|nr:queuosine salvage family protein [Patescibacteria group bacterium]